MTHIRPRLATQKEERWTVYAVWCTDGSLYAGCTNDLPRRLAAHNAGRGARYTRSRRPVRLAWTQRTVGRGRALSLEAAFKRLSRAEKVAVVERSARLVSRGGAWRARAS